MQNRTINSQIIATLPVIRVAVIDAIRCFARAQGKLWRPATTLKS